MNEAMKEPSKGPGGPIVVMGVGNLLLRDEGAGIHVIRALREEKILPDEVELVDAGTSALDALQMIGPVGKLIVVDAVKGGGPPGAIYLFEPDDVRTSDGAAVSLHQMSFLEALRLAERLDRRPKAVTIIGVEPGDISSGMTLSPEVAAKVPDVIRLVQQVVDESPAAEAGTRASAVSPE